MASTTASGNGYILTANFSETSTDSAANTSVVSYSLVLTASSSPSGFSAYSYDTSNTYFVINGGIVAYAATGQVAVSRGNSITVISGSTTITHAANGTATPSFYGRLLMQNPYPGTSYMPPDMTTGTGSLALTDFVRLPSAPAAAPTFTRSTDGLTIDLTSATASSPVTLSKYDYQYSTDQTTWTIVSPMNTTTATSAVASPSFTGTNTTIYYFQTRGVSSEGNGPWSPTAPVNAIPSVPVSITTTRTARSVAITVGASATTGGAPIIGYYVQYSTDSGSTWSTAQALSGGAYTYNNLTPALTYVFRAYSTNNVGSSPTVSSSSMFVPAGGKRYDGATFTSTTTAKRWSGSAWVDLTTAKRWNGSAWVDLS